MIHSQKGINVGNLRELLEPLLGYSYSYNADKTKEADVMDLIKRVKRQIENEDEDYKI